MRSDRREQSESVAQRDDPEDHDEGGPQGQLDVVRAERGCEVLKPDELGCPGLNTVVIQERFIDADRQRVELDGNQEQDGWQNQEIRNDVLLNMAPYAIGSAYRGSDGIREGPRLLHIGLQRKRLFAISC